MSENHPKLEERGTGNKANWKNQTIWTRDNLHVLRGLNSESVDLIYLDPPFNSNQEFEAPIGSQAAGAAFKDAWTFDDADRVYLALLQERDPATFAVIDTARLAHGKGMAAYLGMMAQRLVEMHRVLKPTGNVYLHCDPTASHYLKILMDSLFGRPNFRNEIVWKRANAHPLSIRRFETITDTILYYAKTKSFVFHGDQKPMSKDQIDALYTFKDKRGRFTTTDLSGGKAGGNDSYLPFNGVSPPAGRAWAPPQLSKLPEWATAILDNSYAKLGQLEKCYAL